MTKPASSTVDAPPSLLVLSKFPVEFTQRKILPALARVWPTWTPRVEHPVFVNTVRDFSGYRGVVFMKDMGGTVESSLASARAKAAGIPFLALPRHTSEWPAIFERAHVALPLETAMEMVEDVPSSDAVRLVQRETFRAARRAAREAVGFKVSVVAEVLLISEEALLAYESDSEPIPASVLAELYTLFPELYRAKAKPDVCDDPESPTVHESTPMSPSGTSRLVTQAKALIENREPAAPKAPERSFSAIVDALRVLGKTARVNLIVGEDNTAAIEIDGEDERTLFAWQGKNADEAIDSARLDLDERLTVLETRIARARQGLRV